MSCAKVACWLKLERVYLYLLDLFTVILVHVGYVVMVNQFIIRVAFL